MTTWDYDLFIDGRATASDGDRRITVVDPATEEVIGSVPDSTGTDMRRAIAAARRAFDEGPWPWLKPSERGRVISRMADILTERHPELHELIVAETGATVGGNNIGTADFIQCAGAVGAVRWLGANAASAIDWVESGLPTPGVTGLGGNILVREPAGVVGAITPFNYPFQLNLFKVTPALVAGCTIVLKPHPWTPLDAFEIARAATDAGVPPGVLNVVPGGAEVGDELTGSPLVDVITFTGSTPTGRRIMANAAGTIKRVKLELGGKSARVVLGDASEAYAATIGFTDVLAHCGQGCVLQSRLLLPERLRDAYVDGVHKAFADVRIGDPRDETTTLGPLIRAAHRDRVEELVQSGVAAGARVLVGGKRPADQPRGYFYEPTVLMDARNDMRIAQEEIFGPVLAVIPYDGGDAEAVSIANDSNYGLCGSVWTNDPERGLKVARGVRTGTYMLNSPIPIDFSTPFGGYKESGMGREFGPDGLELFLEKKSINLPAGFSPTV
jgi:aldehyde dehydrogenase (NAD+)